MHKPLIQHDCQKTKQNKKQKRNKSEEIYDKPNRNLNTQTQ